MRNDVRLEGRAETTTPTAVADGADVKAWLDEYGRLATGLRKEESTLLASAARTTAQSANIQLPYHKGIMLFVDVTLDAAAASITPKLEVKDSIGATDKIIWTAAAPIAAVGQFVYLIYPGATDQASYTENVETTLPVDVDFVMAVADTDAITYSVTVVKLP